jgi:hypothetical protein
VSTEGTQATPAPAPTAQQTKQCQFEPKAQIVPLNAAGEQKFSTSDAYP